MAVDKNPVIAFISATPAAVGPATAALAVGFPGAEVWNLLDDRLLKDAVAAGGLTAALEDRMKRLISQAVDSGADGVLLTCSMYGSVASKVAAPVPVLAPDQAAFADAIAGGFRRILVVASIASALADSVERLNAAVAAAGREIEVRGVLAREASDPASAGNEPALVAALASACHGEVAAGDGVLLAQYSLSPAQDELAALLRVPVIAGPHSAINSLRASILGRHDPAPSGVMGAIADDFTGGTDLALSIRQTGLRTLLFFGVPTEQASLPPHDAVVVALKSRTAPADKAVSDSLAAWSWLSRHDARQLYFKYCSTFDSTPQGNIGPVLDALSAAVGASTVVTTPSSPHHGRTVYHGQLFVDGVLLGESHMSRHPLTPMTDSDLPRVLRAQTSQQVAHLSLDTVREGVPVVRAAVTDPPDPAAELSPAVRYLLADSIDDADLSILARAIADQPLSAGAAGLGGALAAIRAAGLRVATPATHETEPVGSGPAAILAGSCSHRTLEQIADFRGRGHAAYFVDLLASPDASILAARALAWADELPTGTTPLLHTSVPPAELQAVQSRLGADVAAALSEEALSRIAQGLVRRGVRRIVCAGGETSGAILQALAVRGATVGAAAAPGVPWIHTLGHDPLALLLKSGNFGDVTLFSRALDIEHREGVTT